MIISLLQVGLLVMGVGVRTSTPIYSNEQPQTTTEQKENNFNIQRNKANEEELEFDNRISTATVTRVEDDTYRYENTNYCSLTRYYTSSTSDALSITLEKYTTANQLFYTPYQSQADYLVYWPAEFYVTETYIMEITPNYPTYDTRITFGLKNNIDYESTDFTATFPTHYKIITSPNFDLGNNYTVVLEGDTTSSQQLISTRITLFGSQKTYVRIITEKSINTNPHINNMDYYPEGDLRDTLIYDEGIDPLLNHTWRPESTKITGDFIRIFGSYTTAQVVQEIVDIPGMMWEILTMPFAFISTAFNLTIFPNTPYAVNISNLVLTIFGVLVFVFIFKLLIKK